MKLCTRPLVQVQDHEGMCENMVQVRAHEVMYATMIKVREHGPGTKP